MCAVRKTPAPYFSRLMTALSLSHILSLCLSGLFKTHWWEHPEGNISLSYSLMRGKHTEKGGEKNFRNSMEVIWRMQKLRPDCPEVNWEKLQQTNNRCAPTSRGVKTSRSWLQLYFKSRYLFFSCLRNHYTSKPCTIYTSKWFPALSKKVNQEQLQCHVRPLFLSRSTGVAARLFLKLSKFSHFASFSLLAESLSVKGPGASARIARSVLSLHFLHPGHAPVPRRDRLQLRLPEQVAFCAEGWIQGAEGGGWRGEVWIQKRTTCWHAFSISSKGVILKEKPFCLSEKGNRINEHLRSTFHADYLGKSKFRSFFEAAVCHRKEN